MCQTDGGIPKQEQETRTAGVCMEVKALGHPKTRREGSKWKAWSGRKCRACQGSPQGEFEEGLHRGQENDLAVESTAKLLRALQQ